MGLGGEDELPVLGHSQPVLAPVVSDDQFFARAEQRLAWHFGQRRGVSGLGHNETIIIITVVVNRSQILFL